MDGLFRNKIFSVNSIQYLLKGNNIMGQQTLVMMKLQLKARQFEYTCTPWSNLMFIVVTLIMNREKIYQLELALVGMATGQIGTGLWVTRTHPDLQTCDLTLPRPDGQGNLPCPVPEPPHPAQKNKNLYTLIKMKPNLKNSTNMGSL